MKRAGKRFTMDMKKELDSLIAECYEDDVEEPSDTTPAALDNTPPTNEAIESPVDAITPLATSVDTQQDTIPPTQEETTSPAQQETTSPTQQETTSPTQQEPSLPTQQEATPLPPEDSPDKPNKPTRPPRKLVYSRSHNKIVVPVIADGNGRTSNPIPVDTNYGNGKETQTKSGTSLAQVYFFCELTIATDIESSSTNSPPKYVRQFIQLRSIN